VQLLKKYEEDEREPSIFINSKGKENEATNR
jgi:hypothetical protein